MKRAQREIPQGQEEDFPEPDEELEIIDLEALPVVNIPTKENIEFFPGDTWTEPCHYFISDKGELTYFNLEKAMLMFGDQPHWEKFSKFIISKNIQLGEEDIYTFENQIMALKTEEFIYILECEKSRFRVVAQIEHKAWKMEDSSITNILFTRDYLYLLIFYKLGETEGVVVWDILANIEHLSFFGRQGDILLDFITGGKSQFGTLCYQNYIVDLDSGVPNPFFSVKNLTDKTHWNQGRRMNFQEDMILSQDEIVSSLCFRDIYYKSNRDPEQKQMEKFMYYVDKESVAFDYIEDSEGLVKVLEVFEQNPIYY